MKKPVLKFRTIFLSDIHLGTENCKIDEVNHFLKHTECEKLVLNGDIIDGWSLRRRGGWKREHTHFIRRVLKKAEKKDTQVIYLAGNHDEILRGFLPVFFDNFQIVESHIHEGLQGRYLCVHGDVFDAVTTHSRWLALLGDIGYTLLLRLNRHYARYRAWRGQEYFSLSRYIKARVKTAVSHLSRYEEHLQALARSESCQGVICGHIHTPDDKWLNGIHYLNSGDWVESLTAAVEHHDGRIEILTYEQFCQRLEEKAKKHAWKHSRTLAEPDFAWSKDDTPVEGVPSGSAA